MRAPAILLPLLLGGCALINATSSSPADAGGGDAAIAGCTRPPCREVVAELTSDLDILFVIDNSHSMKEEQDGLARAFPRFLDTITVEGRLPNLHIGVVSSDLGIGGWTSDACHDAGDNGRLLATPREAGCQAPRGTFIFDVAVADAERQRNYDGSLPDAFSCIARLGITGCGVEQHLEAMKLALDGSRLENQGFLREHAYLAIVILADEDDCSAHDAAIIFNPSASLDNLSSELGPFSSYRCTEFGITCDGANLSRSAADYENCVPRTDSIINDPVKYYEFLKGLKDNPGLLIGAVIAGNPTPFGVGLTERGAPYLKPSCQSSNGIADPAVRLKDFADHFGDNGQFVSICQDDLTRALDVSSNRLGSLLSGCLTGPLFDDPTLPGLQPDCRVTRVTDTTRSSFPACGVAPEPCYELVADVARCPISTGHLRVIVRGATVAPVGTRYIVECFRP